MKKSNLLAVAAVLAALSYPAGAAAPNLLTYQGRLKQNGTPSTGNVDINIFLCNALSLGTCTGTGHQSVPVTNGLFRVVFPVPAAVDLTTGNWYLEVRLDATESTILSPREQLTASAFTVFASSAGTLSAAPGSGGVSVSTHLFVVAGSSVGFGTSLPAANLHVSNDGAGTPRGIMSSQHSTDGNSGLLMTRKSRGTNAAPAAVINGDSLGNLAFQGYDGSSYITPGRIRFVVDGAVSAGSVPTDIEFLNGAAADGTEKMRITSIGKVGVGSAAPQTLLEVNGDAQFGSNETKSTFTTTGSLGLAKNASLTLAGPTGNFVSGASVTASSFFGNGANLSGVTASQVAAANVTAGVMNASVIASSVAASAAGTDQLAVGAVTAAKLGAGAVETGKLASDSITTANILNGAVTTPKLAANAVETAKLAGDAVTTAAILSGAVTTPKLGANAVDTSKLAGDAVTTASILNGAVTTPKLAANAVDTAKLASDAVATGAILNGAVTTPKLAANAVDTGKLAGDAVTTAAILNGAVTTPKLGANAVDTAKLASDAVATGAILNGAVTTSKLAPNAVDTGKLASDAVATGAILNGAVTTPKLAPNAVDTGKLASDAVTTLNILNGAVDTGKLGSGAVTDAKIYDMSASKLTGAFTNSATFVSSVTAAGAVGIGAIGLGNGTLVVRSTSVISSNPVVDLQNNAGVSLLRLQQGGNVGIGTPLPGVLLDVNGVVGLKDGGNRSYYGGMVSETNATMVDFGINEDSGNRFGGTYNSTVQGGLFRVTTGNELFQFHGRIAGSAAAMLQLMSITSAGNVGINANSPQTRLDVNGDAQFGSNAAKSTFTVTGDLNMAAGSSVAVAGVEVVSSTRSLKAAAGIASAPGFAFSDAVHTGLYEPALGAVGVASFGAERLRVTGAGNIGVGTLNPGATVHIRIMTNLTTISTASLRLEHDSSFTPGIGFGSGLVFAGKSNGVSNRDMGQLDAVWGNATDATRSADLRMLTTNNAGQLTERVRITADGNVGIGLATANVEGLFGRSLTVAASSVFPSSAALELGGYASGSDTPIGALEFRNQAVGGFPRIAEIQAWRTGVNGNGALVFNTAGGGPLQERMRITASGGVIIGTPSVNTQVTVHNGDLVFSTNSGAHGIIYQDGSKQFGQSAWELLGRAKLGSNNNQIQVSGLPARNHISFLFTSPGKTGGNDTTSLQFNNTGTVYSFNFNLNNTANQFSAQSTINLTGSINYAERYEGECSLIGASRYLGLVRGTMNAASFPDNLEGAFNYGDTALSIVTFKTLGGSVQFLSGTELLVFGRN